MAPPATSRRPSAVYGSRGPTMGELTHRPKPALTRVTVPEAEGSRGLPARSQPDTSRRPSAVYVYGGNQVANLEAVDVRKFACFSNLQP